MVSPIIFRSSTWPTWSQKKSSNWIRSRSTAHYLRKYHWWTTPTSMMSATQPSRSILPERFGLKWRNELHTLEARSSCVCSVECTIPQTLLACMPLMKKLTQCLMRCSDLLSGIYTRISTLNTRSNMTLSWLGSTSLRTLSEIQTKCHWSKPLLGETSKITRSCPWCLLKSRYKLSDECRKLLENCMALITHYPK